jgi:hypothetical protein
MLNEFGTVILSEFVAPVVAGFFRRAESAAIRRWKIAAWGWLGGSVSAFVLASRLEHPIGIGLALGAASFAMIASIVSAASASVLHVRLPRSPSDIAQPKND